MPTYKEDYCIIRGKDSGVFYGRITSRIGQECHIEDARRIWQWAGAASLSQLSQEGTANPAGCKFPMAVPWVELTDVIEILPCSQKARESIESVPVWRM